MELKDIFCDGCAKRILDEKQSYHVDPRFDLCNACCRGALNRNLVLPKMQRALQALAEQMVVEKFKNDNHVPRATAGADSDDSSEDEMPEKTHQFLKK